MSAPAQALTLKLANGYVVAVEQDHDMSITLFVQAPTLAGDCTELVIDQATAAMLAGWLTVAAGGWVGHRL